METDRIERIEKRLRQRYYQKKHLNLVISAVIVVLGITSVMFIWNYDQEGLLSFRWLTVDGTVFTVLMALCYIAVNLSEMAHYTELTSTPVYFIRLSSAVAEALIITVVLLSQLPISSEHMHIWRYDMFNMHILIPILTITSFLVNDSPIGKLTFRQRLRGTSFVTAYAIVILALILVGRIPPDKIPYFFLDILNLPALKFIGYFVFLYGVSYLFSVLLSKWNLKASWRWFKGIAAC